MAAKICHANPSPEAVSVSASLGGETADWKVAAADTTVTLPPLAVTASMIDVSSMDAMADESPALSFAMIVAVTWIEADVIVRVMSEAFTLGSKLASPSLYLSCS